MRKIPPITRALLIANVAIFVLQLLTGETLLLYFALRRCLQARNLVKPVAFALVTANLVNALGNWVLIYGKWGAPALGLVGSGWSTSIARVYLAAVLVGYLLWYDRKHRTDLLRTPIEPDLRRIRRLIALGLPAGLQITLEIGVFTVATALIGRLGAVPLASHQIAMNTIAFTYMIPLGISSAAAVRVGQALADAYALKLPPKEALDEAARNAERLLTEQSQPPAKR